MRWRKLGMIFDLSKHRLPEGFIGFAQSPQPVVFESHVRVFFSTRAVDSKNGKFLSEVAFVDFTPDFSKVLRVSKRPVIERGGLGCFDEHGIFPMNVVKDGNNVLGYTCGWSRRVSVSVETGIGLAFSKDGGESFQRLGSGPVLTTSLQEPCLVGDGFVLKEGDDFHMWYIFGKGWQTYEEGGVPERTYKIGHAISSDGVSWRKTAEGVSIIPDAIGELECQALPCVIKIDGVYHMFFCFRHSVDFRTNPVRGYRIGHAQSRDMVHWERDDDSIAISQESGSWDSDMMCYPGICQSGGQTYLLYNGNEFGKYGFGAAVLEI
jgi:hypothetical protein